MKLFMFGHGGSGNHGCEAIVRSTCAIFSQQDCALYSYRPQEDQKYGADGVCQIIDLDVATNCIKNWEFFKAYAALKLRGDCGPLDGHRENCLLTQQSKGHSVALSIGGDNYCYGKKGALRFMKNRIVIQKNGIKTVLWGCSVEPELIVGRMRKDLSRYDLITARESITYEALKAVNLNTILAPDPAFTLARQPGIVPRGLKGPYIGVNVSPLIQSMEQGSDDITMENYRHLLRYILAQTDRNIALIPHVVWRGNDDRIPLGQLYEEFRDTGRVFMVEDQNCMQLKDIISGCEFFVGARTHATIAAYSTCVPTLVVGYSVKARGIARDLFGSEDDYVLPVQQLRETTDLTNAFKALYDQKDQIRKHLTDKMPGYIQGVEAAKEAVRNL